VKTWPQAIAYALVRVGRTDDTAIVGLFPADHHYEDVATFSRTIDNTYAAARHYDDRVLLMGTEPDSAEVEYGWIEPGDPLDQPSGNLFRVNRFWEKPARSVADTLLARRCLWNTFVMIGSLGAFRRLVSAAAPDLVRAFQPVECAPPDEASVVRNLYDALTPIDFSHDILAPQPNSVGVARLPNIGWTDLGQPARVQTFLRAHGGPMARLAS
jgi:mannose-1-phosphate guanylyltransferase